MRPLPRLALAVVLALLLPFPGPHADGYTPIVAVLFRRDALSAPMGFFVLAAIVIAVYAAIAFGLLSLIGRRRRQGKS